MSTALPPELAAAIDKIIQQFKGGQEPDEPWVTDANWGEISFELVAWPGKPRYLWIRVEKDEAVVEALLAHFRLKYGTCERQPQAGIFSAALRLLL